MRFVLLLLIGIGIAHADHAEEEMPMYNGEHGPLAPKNLTFSQDAADRGWKYYESGDYATAMRRFNQAWLLDSDNAEAYWGMGLVIGQRARKEEPETNLESSVHCLELALAHAPDNGRIMGDLAFSNFLLSQYESGDGKSPQKAAAHFKTASEYFRKPIRSKNILPPSPTGRSCFSRWATYPLARQRADEAIKAGYPVDPGLSQGAQLSSALRVKWRSA